MEHVALSPPADETTRAGRSTAASPGALVAGGVVFLALTVAVFWYLFHRIDAGEATADWGRLRWEYLALILLCLPVETLASGLRLWVISRVLEPGLGFWICIKAEWANAAVSLLTPSQSGGGAGQMYLLTRGGTSVGTALSITLISAVGTLAALSCLGLYSVAVTGTGAAGPLFTMAAWSLLAAGAILAICTLWPASVHLALSTLSRGLRRLRGRGSHLPGLAEPVGPVDRVLTRVADIAHAYREDVARFVRAGKLTFLAVCLLSLTFLVARAFLPYLWLRFLGIDAWTPRQVVETQVALIFVVFLAPTPGGAGVAEGASLALMAPLVPPGFAPYYHLFWRFSTAYLAALAGFICLGRAALDDAGRAVHDRRARRCP